MKGIDRPKSVILIIAVLFLGFVGWKNFSIKGINDTFNPDYVYRGTSNGQINPKEYFASLNGMTYNPEDSCKPEFKQAKNTVSISDDSPYWFPAEYSGKLKGEPLAELIGTDGSGLYKDKDIIVMPFNSGKLRNTNIKDSTIKDSSAGQHDIEVIVGTEFLVVFDDVMCWWCHAHNPSSDVSHNITLGAGDNTPFQGAILGIAKSSTRVIVYQLKDSENKSLSVGSELSTDDLQQIDSSKFFLSGGCEVVPV